MRDSYALLDCLADGRFHSGEVLGARLGVSRTAVWKALRALSELGLDVQAVRGKGYRLPHAIEFLDRGLIVPILDGQARSLVSALEIHRELDSTNRHLMACAAQGAASGTVCLTEWQRAGRGRRGRTWVSPFGANIYLSILWRFDTGPAALAGLSSALGVAVAQALTAAGVGGFGLKWPNDVLAEGRKLAGVLVEVSGESSGPCHAVVGVGMNLRMSNAAASGIDQPWTDVSSLPGGRAVSRNRLAGLLIHHMILSLARFQAEGLGVFADAWQALDVTAGRRIRLHLPDGIVEGHAAGIDKNGALLLETDTGLQCYASGEVSLRIQP